MTTTQTTTTIVDYNPNFNQCTSMYSDDICRSCCQFFRVLPVCKCVLFLFVDIAVVVVGGDVNGGIGAVF